ncbi:MAG: hypothetical protein ACN6O2_13010 [Stenotrophomonas sp.]
MKKKNVAVVRSMRDRVVSVSKKVAAGVTGAMVSASAFAQSADLPTDVDAAAEWLKTKGAVGIGIAGAITLLIIGIAAAKLPRRGT